MMIRATVLPIAMLVALTWPAPFASAECYAMRVAEIAKPVVIRGKPLNGIGRVRIDVPEVIHLVETKDPGVFRVDTVRGNFLVRQPEVVLPATAKSGERILGALGKGSNFGHVVEMLEAHGIGHTLQGVPHPNIPGHSHAAADAAKEVEHEHESEHGHWHGDDYHRH